MEPVSPAAIPVLDEALAETRIRSGVLVAWGMLAGIFACIAAVLMLSAPAGGVVFGVLAGAVSSWTLALGRRRVSVKHDGLHIRTIFGDKQLRYRDVDTVRFDTDQQQGELYLKFAGAGTTVSMRWLQMPAAIAIGRHVSAHVSPRLVDVIARDLLAGRSHRFGTITATRSGLRQGDKAIGWHEIDRVDRSPAGLRVFPVDRPGDVIGMALNAQQAPLLGGVCKVMTERTSPGPRRAVVVDGFDAKDAKLGVLVAGRGRRLQRFNRVATGTAVTTAALGAIAALALRDRNVELAVVMAGVALVVVLLGSVIAWSARKQLAVYERGITDGRSTIVFDDATSFTRTVIDQYVNGAYSGRTTTVVVRSATTKIATGGNDAEAEALGESIMKRVVPVIAARHLAELQATGSVKSGPLTLSRDAITLKKKRVALDDIAHIEAQQGHLHIWTDVKKKSALSFSLGDDNALVAAEVLSALLTPAAPDADADADDADESQTTSAPIRVPTTV